MTFEQQLDDRIKTYSRELAILEPRIREWQQASQQTQIRILQIQGAINELNDLKTKLNGSTPQ